VIADITIGPRQIIAVSSSTRKPIDMIVVELGLFTNACQARHRRAVDVGIEQADAQAQCLQAERKVERSGRLADAALARGDSDDGGDAGDFRLPCHRRACRAVRRTVRRDRRHARPWSLPRRLRRRARLALRGERDHGRGDARQRAHRAFGLRAHVFPGARLDCIDVDGEEHFAVIDRDGGQHIGIGQRNPARRFHLREGI
jgi:hypothetical protein